MTWPVPNACGVYSKEDAETFIFENKHVQVIAYLLRVEADTWLHAVSFSLKVLPEDGCTAGRYAPLKAWDRLKSNTREDALEHIRKEIAAIVQTGQREININAWSSTWLQLDVWGFNIDRQFELFA